MIPDLPNGAALLALAQEVLVHELAPLLPEERRPDALLIARCMAIAEHEAALETDAAATLRDIGNLYEPRTPALPPQGGESDGPATREGEGQVRASSLIGLLRRFARDLRIGAFESSHWRDREARVILWQLTIARLRRSNPRFLAANGFG